MQADFTVLDGNLLHVLRKGGDQLPAVRATYVKGQCRFALPTFENPDKSS